MKVFELPVLAGSPARLTCYIHELSPEMAHRAVRPAMLVLPGGGYHFCSDREAEPVAMDWFCKGYNAFVLRYTVISEDIPAPLYQLPLKDAVAAMDLIRSNAAAWGVAPDKVAVLGFSAGGHLATMLATHWDDVRLGGKNARPDAAVLCYPVVSSRPAAGTGDVYVTEKLTAGEEAWMAYFAGEEAVRPDMPQAFVWTTFTDATVSIGHSLALVGAMHRAGVPCELHLYDAGAHGYALANGETWAGGLPVSGHIASWRTLAAQWLNDLFDWQD